MSRHRLSVTPATRHVSGVLQDCVCALTTMSGGRLYSAVNPSRHLKHVIGAVAYKCSGVPGGERHPALWTI
jgi:hypothetical protein